MRCKLFFQSSLEDLANFLEEIKAVQLKLKRRKNCVLSGIELGQEVEATALRTAQGSPTVVKLKSAKHVEARCWTKFDEMTDITGRVIWIDYLDRIVWVQPFQNNGKFYEFLKDRIDRHLVWRTFQFFNNYFPTCIPLIEA